uniref:RING-type E3 ubiquitin transferase n=1 Tax=Kalanchoe fedtschenkoi TaxID=63787 RepID=A0A7N0RIA8_KALFE
MMKFNLSGTRIRNLEILGVIAFCLFTLADSYFQVETLQPVDVDRNDPPITYKYDRLEEVKTHCQDVLATASDLKPDDNRIYSIQNELSFVNGDWEQSPGKAPLLPFSDASPSWNGSQSFDNQSLASKNPHLRSERVSFWITDVDSHKGSKSSIRVSGVLSMGITSYLDDSFDRRTYARNPEFHMWPGHSEISILFQGIYVESEQNKEKRVLCLLGNAMLPSRQQDLTEPRSIYDHQPSLLQDDQLLLVLHYPKTLTLTDMVIKGNLKSLNPRDNPKYFDEARIISHLSSSLSSKYVSTQIVSKACNPHNGESCVTPGTDVYKQSDFCSLLEQLSKGEAFTVLPNWKCNGTDEYCSRLGPFLADKEINVTDGSFKGVRLVMQNVRCEQTTSKDGVTSAQVLAVFRAVSPLENYFYAASRSGLNNMTVVSEGIWSSSSGQLCMIACHGIISSEEDCNSRACMYIPLSFSIKQRSILVGRFSSLNSSAKPYFPLSFEKLLRPNELWQLQTTEVQYRYSKIEEAGTILEKDQPFNFGNVIKKSLMKFPKLDKAVSYAESISLLSEDLRFQISALPQPTPHTRIPRIELRMDIISLGPMLSQTPESQSVSTADEDAPYLSKTEYTERQILLNVSAQLTISSKTYISLSVIFLEGIYDPHIGKMYLVGCRDVRASWRILYESMDLEAGLDCQIEVVVSYPPTTARWFMNPTAMISISSKRNEDDPLHFPGIKLQTFPLLYRMQREDILSRGGIEGILRVLTLTMTVTFVLSQLIYIRESMDSVPFISLTMLGVQVLGYSLHLVTGAEAIFGGMASISSQGNSSYALEKYNGIKLINYCIKLLVLVSFLLTLRLCQRVWKSRIRLLSCTPLEPHRVPSDRGVIIITFIIHLVGYATVLIMHATDSTRKPLQTERYIDSTGRTHQTWSYEKIGQTLSIGQFRLLPSASRAYQRLPSKTTEAELVSGIGSNPDHQESHASEE